MNIRTVNKVFENRELLLECLDKIQNETQQPVTRDQAGNFQRLMTDNIFVFWLTPFRHIMPHVDFLYDKIQMRRTDHIKQAVSELKLEIEKIRNKMSTIIEEITEMPAVCEL